MATRQRGRGQSKNAGGGEWHCEATETWGEPRSERTSKAYREFSEHLEEMHFGRKNIVEAKRNPFRGRGKDFCTKIKPLMPHPRLSPEVTQAKGGYGIVTKLWVTARTMLHKLKRAISKGTGLQADLQKANVLGLLEASTPDLRAAWESVPRTGDVVRATHAIKMATVNGAGLEEVERALQFFKRNEECKAKTNLESKKENLVAWLAKLMANGAREGHRYTNAPNATYRGGRKS